MTSPTPWEACGNVIRDADSIEVCTVALWCKQPSEAAARIVRAVNAHGALVEALGDLVPLARAAMQDAIRDGAEYDIAGELADAQAALAKAGPQ